MQHNPTQCSSCCPDICTSMWVPGTAACSSCNRGRWRWAAACNCNCTLAQSCFMHMHVRGPSNEARVASQPERAGMRVDASTIYMWPSASDIALAIDGHCNCTLGNCTLAQSCFMHMHVRGPSNEARVASQPERAGMRVDTSTVPACMHHVVATANWPTTHLCAIR